MIRAIVIMEPFFIKIEMRELVDRLALRVNLLNQLYRTFVKLANINVFPVIQVLKLVMVPLVAKLIIISMIQPVNV